MALRPFVPALILCLALFALQAPARAGEVGYPTLIAGQLASAMDLSREEGKALEGVSVTVDLELDSAGRVAAADIVAVEDAPDPQMEAAATEALAEALDHFRKTAFQDLDPDDYPTWGHMLLTFQLGLHVGGYQP